MNNSKQHNQIPGSNSLGAGNLTTATFGQRGQQISSSSNQNQNIDASPSVGLSGSMAQQSPAGSQVQMPPPGGNRMFPSNFGPQGGRNEVSNIHELSQSILQTPGQMSNFMKNRGFLDPNRLLRAPQFSNVPRMGPNQMNTPNQDVSNISQTDLLANVHGARAGELSSNTQVLWGTNINTNDLSQRLREFLTTFILIQDDDQMDLGADGNGNERYMQEPFYISKLKQIAETEEYTLDVDCEHIFKFNQQLYRQLEDYPTDVIPIFDLVALNVFKDFVLSVQNVSNVPQNNHTMAFGGNPGSNMQPSAMIADQDQSDQVIQVRPYNMMKSYRVRELDPAHIDKLIQFRGIVIRTSDVKPEMKEAYFQCQKCGREEYKYIERGKITEPDRCEGCNSDKSFELIHNLCMFGDKQHIKLQETPEAVPEGETPQTVHMCAYEDMVDFVRPGDRVEVVGIYRAIGIRVNANVRTVKNIYRTYLDVIGYVKTDKRRYDMGDEDANARVEENKGDLDGLGGEDDENMVGDEDQDQALSPADAGFTDDEVRKFKEFASKPEVYDLLVDALAPSIWECNDVKRGILCQLFGGVSKDFKRAGASRFRGEINVLLCGDPSTAKSQLLQYVHKISPRGIYTSGKGSSAVGLTVYVTKDPETKEIVLESGALVLSDRGVCCIDEFDKMDDSTRVILHEAMEQQTVSVAKAGIICSLNARTAILAAANPINSKYDPRLSVIDNIKLPPTLLSRFDLIYLVLDKQSEASDRRLANHIVSMYSNMADGTRPLAHGEENQATELLRSNSIDRDFLAKYISYARKCVKPKIPDNIQMDLVQEYVKMRSLGNTTKTVTATPRQLESMIRISESLAKMRLSEIVEKRDVDEAVMLIKNALQQSATDPTTGKINMDIITTGQTKTSADKLKVICDYIKNIQTTFRDRVNNNGLRYENLFDFLQAKWQSGSVPGVKENESMATLSEKEYREALRYLEDDGVLNLIGHSSAPQIRFLQSA